LIRRYEVAIHPGAIGDDRAPARLSCGVDAIRAEIESQVQLVPSLTVDVKNLVETGGIVVVERADTFETQGKSLDLEVVGVFEIDGSGLIKRLRDYYDLNTLMDRVAAAFA
jgi:limonene-1,2-epoxide hydrolase